MAFKSVPDCCCRNWLCSGINDREMGVAAKGHSEGLRLLVRDVLHQISQGITNGALRQHV
jgi:hypothetical protein